MRSITISLLAVIIIVLTGKVYMWARRPVLPAGPAIVLHRFAPNVEIGATAASHKKRFPDMRYVSHLGFVATNTDTTGRTAFSQVRLLIGEKPRSRTFSIAQKSDVEAVELVSARNGIFSELASDLTTMMGMPREGCIRSETPGNFREVRLWSTLNDHGGVALTNDYGGNADVVYPGMVVVSVIVYRGSFKDSETLRANFERRPCHEVAKSAAQALSGELAIAARASESLTSEYADAAAEGRAVQALDREAARRWREKGVVEACPAPAIDASSFRAYSLEPLPVSISMPPGWEWYRGRTRDARRDSMYATFSSPDGQLTLSRNTSTAAGHTISTATSHSYCDEPIVGAQVHIEAGMSPGNGYRKLVSARYALPTGGSLTVQGYASSPEAQAVLLRAVRTVNFRYFW